MRLHRWQIQHVRVVDSTQDSVRDALHREPRGLFCVRADEQRSGRGRRGRDWMSPRGGLWCSLNLHLPKPEPFQTLLLATAALEWAADWAHAPGRLFIKWPNDLMIETDDPLARVAKWGGVMAESQTSTANQSTVIFGLGLNLDLDRSALAKTVAPAPVATSLRAEFGASPSPRVALSAILQRFDELLEVDALDRSSGLLRASRHVRTIGHTIQWLDDQGATCVGTALELTRQGSLIVQRAGGQRDTLVAGEVRHIRAR